MKKKTLRFKSGKFLNTYHQQLSHMHDIRISIPHMMHSKLPFLDQGCSCFGFYPCCCSWCYFCWCFFCFSCCWCCSSLYFALLWLLLLSPFLFLFFLFYWCCFCWLFLFPPLTVAAALLISPCFCFYAIVVDIYVDVDFSLPLFLLLLHLRAALFHPCYCTCYWCSPYYCTVSAIARVVSLFSTVALLLLLCAFCSLQAVLQRAVTFAVLLLPVFLLLHLLLFFRMTSCCP